MAITVLTFNRCARCGGEHEAIEVKALTRPGEPYTHWATCPANGEPILVAFIPDDEMDEFEDALATLRQFGRMGMR